jgi:hypothetical protein
VVLAITQLSNRLVMIVRHDYLFLPLFTSFGTLRSFPSGRF